MARDITIIQSSIETALDNGLTPLGVVLSASQVANWKLYRDTSATVDFAFEMVMDTFQSDVQSYIDSKQVGSLSWYALKTLEFQYGDNLIVTSEGVITYAAIDASKQVVKVVSVKESEDPDTGVVTLVIKAANVVNGVTMPLTDAEKLGLRDYFKNRKIAGTKLLIVSQPADVIKYDVTVVYNPEYAVDNVQAGILAAREDFRTKRGFDPLFYKTSFEAMILAVPGVVALQVNTLTGKPDGEDAEAITLGYELASGYFNYDNTSSLTFTAA